MARSGHEKQSPPPSVLSSSCQVPPIPNAPPGWPPSGAAPPSATPGKAHAAPLPSPKAMSSRPRPSPPRARKLVGPWVVSREVKLPQAESSNSAAAPLLCTEPVGWRRKYIIYILYICKHGHFRLLVEEDQSKVKQENDFVGGDRDKLGRIFWTEEPSFQTLLPTT